MNIYDIAKEAGVSTATVSRYINQSGYVGKKTSARLEQLIRDKGYAPSAAAKNLSTGASFKLIGLVCYLIDDLYYAKSVSVLEKELRKSGYEMILSCAGKSAAEKERAIAMLIGKSVDAIIFIGSVFMDGKGELIKAAAARVPCFIINAEVCGENIYPVYCDDRAAVHAATEALIESGCNAPLYLYDVDTYGSAKKRRGFLDAYPGGRTVQVPETLDGITAAFAEIYAAHRPDGVICSNDVIAAGVLGFTKSAGIPVPERLKLIGHNNSMLAQCTSPTITSIDNRVEALSAITAQNLVRLFTGGQKPEPFKIDYMIKRRESF